MAIRIHRVYTKIGDGGQTQTVSGKLTSKDNPLIHLYGEFEELGVQMGFLRTYLEEHTQFKELNAWTSLLKKIQNCLFDLGYAIADTEKPAVITQEQVKELEVMIDSVELTPLKSFILAGGNFMNCHSHLCRVQCRRVERNVVAWSKENKMHQIYLAYVNRLSDVFFVLARLVSSLEKKPEYLWDNGYKE